MPFKRILIIVKEYIQRSKGREKVIKHTEILPPPRCYYVNYQPKTMLMRHGKTVSMHNV